MAKGVPVCPDGGCVRQPASFQNQKLYDALVDAFSMRSFVPTPGVSGHDQFFATFDRFDGIDKTHAGRMAGRGCDAGGRQNEQYLEVMQTPATAVGASLTLWNALGWPATPAGARLMLKAMRRGLRSAELDALRKKLRAGGLGDEAAREAKELDDALAERNRIEHCGQPDAAVACRVKMRYLYQVLRAFPPQVVFAQTLMGFDIASADPNVVGINFVQPEDAYLAMSEYNRQMHMLDYLHSVYPQVHISLHAGELAPGLVPPEGLTFHIREAIEVGHAERIGHGVDAMYESDPRALLKEMADRHVMVEINLTSNDVILGVTPPHHPLPEYRAAHVPVALSTDDEGVSRIDLTHEYVRAAMEYGLGYLDLKAMARTSMEHSFLPGESLWEKPDDFYAGEAGVCGAGTGRGLADGGLPGSAAIKREGGRAVGAGAPVRGLRGESAVVYASTMVNDTASRYDAASAWMREEMDEIASCSGVGCGVGRGDDGAECVCAGVGVCGREGLRSRGPLRREGRRRNQGHEGDPGGDRRCTAPRGGGTVRLSGGTFLSGPIAVEEQYHAGDCEGRGAAGFARPRGLSQMVSLRAQPDGAAAGERGDHAENVAIIGERHDRRQWQGLVGLYRRSTRTPALLGNDHPRPRRWSSTTTNTCAWKASRCRTRGMLGDCALLLRTMW